MLFAQITPFRQMSRAYSALLQINAKLDSVSDTAQALRGIEAAVRTLQPPEPTTLPAPLRAIDVHEALGFKLLLDSSSLVDKTVIETGTWEPEQLSYFSGLIERLRGRSGLTFFDIGAYWGLYSLVAHRSQAFGAQFAFEADAFNHGQLQANLFLNGAARAVRVFNQAVSDRAGTVMFWDSRTHPDGNHAGVGVLKETDNLPGYPVRAVPIDDANTAVGCHILAKIDVEGHEAAVLRGMERTIKNNKVVMQIEIFEQHHDEVFAEIDRLGLRTVHSIYPDFYVTNISVDELGV